jgi:2,3-bisphosphoglycerate-independent phosphoglycerate mutase
MTVSVKPFVLIILDGFGYRETKQHNAIANAKMPRWNYMWQHYPHTLIQSSGHSVGLPDGQMGNSEVGHLNIGAGRIVYQELTRIDQAIADDEFKQNAAFLTGFQQVKKNNSALHVMGLLSPGGVHSHENQIIALLKLAVHQGVTKVYFHAFLDGRDTPPQSALPSLQAVANISGVKIVSITGRYYAMDRDKRWERTQQAYDLLTLGKAEFHAADAISGLENAYTRGETDEFVKPMLIGPTVTIKDGDAVIFMNFRADRARQLSRALTDEKFEGFARQVVPKLSAFITLTQYADDIQANVAFPPQSLANVLGEYLANCQLKQFRIAETEKYAHVTFFFNGGRELPFPGEERTLIPSAKVATYDLHPEMSAREVTEKLTSAIRAQDYAFIVCNYANPDMLGHTGNYQATLKSLEILDQCLGEVCQAVVEVNGEMLITADHGNAECMYDDNTKQPHTAHTSDPVPLVYVGRSAEFIQQSGRLSDIAPTLLYLMGLPQPAEMTGHNLLKLS